MKLSGHILKLFGWKMDPMDLEDDRFIALGVPHSSIWDFAVAWLYMRSQGYRPSTMVKKEFFKGPLGWLLRSLGAFPMDRKHPTAMVKSVIDESIKRDTFCLAIAPEGTRKPVKRWKSGFHLIARATGMPVYLGFYDWKHKHVGPGIRFTVSDDFDADLLKIQQFYKDMDVDGLRKGCLAYLDEIENQN